MYTFMLIIAGQTSFAQTITGEIYGRVLDERNQPLEFATVWVYDGEIAKGASKADAKGYYSIKPLANDIVYNLKATYVGMGTVKIMNIQLQDKVKVNIQMEIDKSVFIIDGGPCWKQKEPLIDPSNPGRQIMRRSDMEKLPIR